MSAETSKRQVNPNASAIPNSHNSQGESCVLPPSFLGAPPDQTPRKCVHESILPIIPRRIVGSLDKSLPVTTQNPLFFARSSTISRTFPSYGHDTKSVFPFELPSADGQSSQIPLLKSLNESPLPHIQVIDFWSSPTDLSMQLFLTGIKRILQVLNRVLRFWFCL